MDSEQRKKLRGYAAQEDRKPEPVFVGREDLFRVVEKNIRSVKSDGFSTGSTVCLTGPPGAGKSAFVNELKKRKDFEEFTAHCVEINRADLYHPGCVLATFANAVKGFEFEEKFQNRLSGFGIGFSLPGGGGGRASLSWNPKSRPPFTSFPADLFREGAKKLLKRGDAFILVIDEAQNIKNTPGSRANDLLAHLHQGLELPIVPVLAGLPNTQENLRETISRFSYGNEPLMVGLEDSEALEYAEAMLDWLGAEGTPAQRQALADWIVGQCGAGRDREAGAKRQRGQPGAWPHHLSNAMKAVAEGLLAADSMRLEELDSEAVRTSLARRRADYYESRYRSQDALALCRDSTRAVLAEASADPIPGHEMPQKVLEIFNRPAVMGETPNHPGVSDLQFYNALRLGGLLAQRRTPQGAREWVCPIASMARYIETGDHDLAEPFPDLREGGGVLGDEQEESTPGG